ncbi:MAG: transglutaminase-like domain-containing protein [Acidimicrobiales bacterium]
MTTPPRQLSPRPFLRRPPVRYDSSILPTVLDYYAAPGCHTDLSGSGIEPGTVEQVVEMVQGLLVYDLAATDLYGVDLSSTQAMTVHERNAGSILAAAQRIDHRPFDVARPPGDRVGGRCHTYALLTVALLRAAGVPARSRCGFGTYFVPDYYEDHWVAEYWDRSDGRWVMVDPQLDPTWRRMLGLDPEARVVEVGPEEYVTAGHAWRAWRAGDLDADRCGLTSIQEHGAFWIAGNLRLDLAALNKVEMLPWDVWGLHWQPSERPSEATLAVFDAVAALTVDPDAHFDEMRRRYDTDHFRVDGHVFSVALGEFVEV